MAWRPISEAPRHTPFGVRLWKCGDIYIRTVGFRNGDNSARVCDEMRDVTPQEFAAMEWDDEMVLTAVKENLPKHKPYTNCDTAGPIYSPEWFSECCDLAAKVEAEKHAEKVAEVMPSTQSGAAGDYPIDFVPAGLNPGETPPTVATIVSTEKRGRGRPVGSKGKPPECVKYFKGLVGEFRNKGVSYQAIEIALRGGEHPYPVPCLSTISRYGSEIEKATGVKFNVVRPSQFCRKEAWAYYNPLIIEMLDAGCSTSEIFLKLREGRHPHKVPGRSTIANWVNARKQQAAKANEPTITGEVKYAGGLFGMADNAPRGAESEVGIGE